MQSILRLIKTTILLLVVLLSATTCGDKENQEPPFLTVESNTLNLLAEATSKSIPVKTNLENWTAAVEANAHEWLKAKKQGNELIVTVTENNGEAQRQGSITLAADGASTTIKVEQMGIAPAILLTSEIFTLPANGGEINLEVTSNIAYEIIIPAEATWLTEKEPSDSRAAMVKKNFTYLVAWNKEESQRRSEIIVRQINGTLEKKALVIQKPQEGYQGTSNGDIKDDVKVPVSSGTASSFQPGAGLEKSFDGNYESMYHSAWANSDVHYFPITLDYHFTEQESIDYLVYHPRNQGSNGLFKQVEIWVASEASPTLTKRMDFDFKGSNAATKVIFDKPLVNPKTVRFVVKSGSGDGQGFASCAEMEFYRINPDNFDPLTLFSDITCSELKPGITIEDIEKVSNNLYRNIAYYLLNGNYPDEFRIQDYRAWPHPQEWARESKTSALSLLDNSTGISVSEGEELIVFVGNTNGYTISLKIQNLDMPGGDGYNNASFYPLSQGVNKINARNKGLAYIFYHTPDYKTAPAVKIHFATGTVNGYYDSQKHAPSEWNSLLNNAKDKYFDVIGEYAHLTFETEAFRTYTGSQGPQLIEAYDELVRLEQEFMGLMKYNRPAVNRAYFHVMYKSYMYASSYRTAYVSGTQEAILTPATLRTTPWGPAHEMGHLLQTRPGFKWQGMTEVTNNLHSLYVQTEWGNPSRIESEEMGRYNNRYEKAYHSSFVKKTAHPAEADVFCKLVSLWQLQLYFAKANGYDDLYKDLYEMVRTTPDKSNAGEQQLNFVRMICALTGSDLTGFFRQWGYLTSYDAEVDDYGTGRITITQSQINELENEINAANYSPVTEKIEYICDSNWEIFRDKKSLQTGTASKSGLTITTTGWQNVEAYEVYDGEQLLFVSNRSSFTLDSEPTVMKVYAVAYDGTRKEIIF